jgi:hypothetical protein
VGASALVTGAGSYTGCGEFGSLGLFLGALINFWANRSFGFCWGLLLPSLFGLVLVYSAPYLRAFFAYREYFPSCSFYLQVCGLGWRTIYVGQLQLSLPLWLLDGEPLSCKARRAGARRARKERR